MNPNPRLQDNWLATPFLLRRSAPRIFVTLRFSVRDCSSLRSPSPSCRETLTLYYRQADSQREVERAWGGQVRVLGGAQCLRTGGVHFTDVILTDCRSLSTSYPVLDPCMPPPLPVQTSNGEKDTREGWIKIDTIAADKSFSRVEPSLPNQYQPDRYQQINIKTRSFAPLTRAGYVTPITLCIVL